MYLITYNIDLIENNFQRNPNKLYPITPNKYLKVN